MSDKWDDARQRTVRFKHVDGGSEIFDGKVCSSTIGKVLVDLPDNAPERYIWFLKRDLEMINS